MTHRIHAHQRIHINPFNAYHAAIAITEDKTILSTEHVYDRIKGIRRIDPETYADQI